jgi:5-methyltetrahydrofolate--homocysteine methyltransferase
MPIDGYKEDIEQGKRRAEAWWNHEIIDRVAIQVTAPRKPFVPETNQTGATKERDAAALREYFTDPEEVIPRLQARLANTYFGGEAFPVMYPVSINMVAILSNYLGCPMRFVNETTTWSEHILDDWEQRPAYRYDPSNEWWLISERLLTAGVERSDGYYVGVPDLNGPTEMLSRLRSPQNLALDLYDQPQYIKPALVEINRVWYDYWRACTDITQRLGGNFHWMGIWSDKPSTDLQSDFSCMMSPQMFDEYFLPFLDEQTQMVERTVYHLDGPGAVVHLDSLLRLPDLDGIQWVPGAGAKPTVEWIPLLRKIQDAGKLVYAYCDKANVRTLLQELRPEGLMLVVSCDSVDEADQLLENVQAWTRQHKQRAT